ncbi:MAG TPA: translation elongation factor Ts [Treponemataceae bacterium]|jgi:elongation factor Ts|nr:translation elongation factor Ts [Treponemataceae bacterium]
MDIKAADVKALREKTGAGMMECKNALVQCNGDSAAAEKLLKEKGLAAVEKRANRATSEGRIFVKTNGSKLVICEVTCETDFVSKNAEFIEVGEKIAETALAKNITSVTQELSDMLLNLATKIRENMMVKRLELIDIPAGTVCSHYIHSDAKTGVVVLIKADPANASQNETLKEFAYNCCLHIAAFTPAYIRKEEVDAAYIEEQKDIFAKQVAELDKPENVKAGIIQGKISKHLADICFVDQPFVKDDKLSVAKKMEQIAKEIGASLTLSKVVTYLLGA